MTAPDPSWLASMAQGWAYALNTVAHPAPEHIEAAQEALNALEAADRSNAWEGARGTLAQSLEAARLRVHTAPPITLNQLAEALEQLEGLGFQLAADPKPHVVLADARADSEMARRRIDELEDQLARTEAEARKKGAAQAVEAWSVELAAMLGIGDPEPGEDRPSPDDLIEMVEGQTEAVKASTDDVVRLTDELTTARRELSDAVRARDEARQQAKEARDKLSMHVQTAGLTAVREHRLWVLRQLGFNPPGFAHMDAQELAAEEEKALRESHRAAGNTLRAENSLRRAWGHLRRVQGPTFDAVRPERLEELAEAVRAMAERALQRFAEMDSSLRRMETDLAVRAPLTVESYNAQAQTIRELRAELEMYRSSPRTDSGD
jgi:hypothetical protein